MAQNDGEWKKDQEVEIYEISQQKWIIGKIHDIREEDGQNIYCVEYDEYSREIREKDVHSFMRIPNTDIQPTDIDDKLTNFMKLSAEMAHQLPVPDQIQILSENLKMIGFPRMGYVNIKTNYLCIPLLHPTTQISL